MPSAVGHQLQALGQRITVVRHAVGHETTSRIRRIDTTALDPRSFRAEWGRGPCLHVVRDGCSKMPGDAWLFRHTSGTLRLGEVVSCG